MTTHKEVLELVFKTHSNNERHRTLAETRYWCEQYKLLAKTAIEALAQPEQELFSAPNNFYKDVDEAINKLEKNGSIFDGNDSAPYVVWLLRTLRKLTTQTQPKEPEQEPMAFELYHHIVLKLAEAGCKLSEQQKMVLCNLKSVTTPPQRKPLTEDEAVSAVSSVLPVTSTGGQTHHLQIQHKHALEITRAVEAAHGIKEST